MAINSVLTTHLTTRINTPCYAPARENAFLASHSLRRPLARLALSHQFDLLAPGN